MEIKAIQPRDKDNPDFRWGRGEIAQKLAELEQLSGLELSEREVAERLGIARSTMQHWVSRRETNPAPAAWVLFFESPEGLEFLHRLMAALVLVMVQMGACGIRLVCLVLELSGLSAFVAGSYGSQQKASHRMEGLIGEFGSEERERLSKLMTPKEITVCQDETFHPQTCLVGLEPVSDFILVEQYAQKRDGATWKSVMEAGLTGLPVTVIQSCSDEGKGLLGYVGMSLGLHHSPDVFHGQYELHRAFGPRLRGRVREAETQVEQAQRELDMRLRQKSALEQTYQKSALRRLDLNLWERRAQDAFEHASSELEGVLSLKQRIREAIKGVGQDYHPFDLDTGVARSANEVEAALKGRLKVLNTAASELALPEPALERVKKSERLVPKMVATVAFVHRKIAALLDAALLKEAERELTDKLIGAFYVKLVAKKAQKAAERRALRAKAHELETVAWERSGKLSEADSQRRQALEALARSCAEVFQRSSSCVEGRNGYLELHHMSLHRLRDSRLIALTVLHNYFVKRADRTTAAERFFGHKPRDLFEYLLERMDYPARPAAPMRRADSHQLPDA
jgi:hypothetical protein